MGLEWCNRLPGRYHCHPLQTGYNLLHQGLYNLEFQIRCTLHLHHHRCCNLHCSLQMAMQGMNTTPVPESSQFHRSCKQASSCIQHNSPCHKNHRSAWQKDRSYKQKQPCSRSSCSHKTPHRNRSHPRHNCMLKHRRIQQLRIHRICRHRPHRFHSCRAQS